MAAESGAKSGGGFNWGSFMSFASQMGSGGGGGQAQAKSAVPSYAQVQGLDFGGSNQYASYAQQQTKAQTEATDKVADAMGEIRGGFGQGFTYGYQGAKMTTAPFLAYRAAKYQKKILGMQAELSDLQAKAYQTAAEDVLRAGQQQVAAITFQAGQVKAATRVSQANAGIRIGGAGSAAETLASQAIMTEMQVNQTLANAVTQSYGYQRAKTQQKINSLAIRSAQSSISPWAAAITAHIESTAAAAPQMDFGSMGGGGGKSGAKAPTKGGGGGPA